MNKELQPRRGDIFFAEISNDKYRGKRPVVIISNNRGNSFGETVVAVIIATGKKPLPTHVYLGNGVGLREKSVATCEDIVTISKGSLRNYVGTIINTPIERELNRALKISLSL